MTYLISTTGLVARIHELSGREPFMLGQELAKAYGTEYRRLTEAVRRNPDRFEEDFAFYLTAEEAERLPQNAATSSGQRTDLRQLVFTHIGAYALSGVLKTPTAAEVSKHIHRGFAAMEKRAFDQMKWQLAAVQSKAMRYSPLRVQVVDGVRHDMTFDAIWLMGSASRPKLLRMVYECLAMQLIDRVPAGTPPMEVQHDLFAAG